MLSNLFNTELTIPIHKGLLGTLPFVIISPR